MNKKEVIELIGKEYWKDFLRFMNGQTTGQNEDGSIDYYKADVIGFIYSKKKINYGTMWD